MSIQKDHDMTETNERLARLEMAMETTQAAMGTMAEAVTELSKTMSDVVATLRHPGKENCILIEDVAELKADNKELRDKHDTLKARVDKAEGAITFGKWLVGAATAIGIGNIIVALKLVQTLSTEPAKPIIPEPILPPKESTMLPETLQARYGKYLIDVVPHEWEN